MALRPKNFPGLSRNRPLVQFGPRNKSLRQVPVKYPSSRATFLNREGIHYSRKQFVIRQRHDEEKNFNILCLQAFNLAPKMGHPCWQLALRSQQGSRSPLTTTLGRNLSLHSCVICNKHYVVPRQIKPRILEFSIRKGKAT